MEKIKSYFIVYLYEILSKENLFKNKINKVSVLLIGSKDVQWEFVHGLLENSIYGGRIDNYFDLRVLQSYLKQFFNSSIIDVLNQRNKKSIFPYSISLPNSCSILVGRNSDFPCISCMYMWLKLMFE